MSVARQAHAVQIEAKQHKEKATPAAVEGKGPKHSGAEQLSVDVIQGFAWRYAAVEHPRAQGGHCRDEARGGQALFELFQGTARVQFGACRMIHHKAVLFHGA